MRRPRAFHPRDLDLDTAEPQEPSPPPREYKHGSFDYERLDAASIARQALTQGEAIARGLPADRAYLAEQLRRALLDAYLGVAETASQTGPPRVVRARTTRASASAAAAALDAIQFLGLIPADDLLPTIQLLGRLCAMLTRLAARTLPQ